MNNKYLYFFIVVVGLGLVSCGWLRHYSALPVTTTDTLLMHDTIIQIDTFYIPISEGSLNAFLECDSNNKVILRKYEQIKDSLKSLILVKQKVIYKEKARVVHDVIEKEKVKVVKEVKKVVPLWIYICLVITGLVTILGIIAKIK